MDIGHISCSVVLVLALAFVLYMRIKYPSPSKVEENGARVAAVILFVLLALLFLAPR
jgi:hypothetical protein